MTELLELESMLKAIDPRLEDSKPSFIKNAKVLFRFEDIGPYKSELILMGLVYVFIETENKYAILDLYGVDETYGIQKTKEEAELYIIKNILEFHDSEDDYFDDFWNRFKFDKVRWIDKAIDINRYFSVIDALHVGIWRNMPFNFELIYITFDPIKEKESKNSTDGYGTINLHVDTGKNSFILDWNERWCRSNEKDPDLAFFSLAESIIKKEEYSLIWDSIDLEGECWK